MDASWIVWICCSNKLFRFYLVYLSSSINKYDFSKPNTYHVSKRILMRATRLCYLDKRWCALNCHCQGWYPRKAVAVSLVTDFTAYSTLIRSSHLCLRFCIGLDHWNLWFQLYCWGISWDEFMCSGSFQTCPGKSSESSQTSSRISWFCLPNLMHAFSENCPRDSNSWALDYQTDLV